MGICARSIPTPPSCTSIRYEGNPSHPRRSGALRTASAETARSEPSLAPGNPDACFQVRGEPPPSRSLNSPVSRGEAQPKKGA